MDNGQTEKAQERPTGLSAKQEMAVRAMVRGKGVMATARSIGVSRVTLYRWMQEPAFVAAMNRWRSAVFETARGQIAGVLNDAAQTVANAVREGDGRLALAVLREVGVLEGLGGPGAGLDAETVARRMELDRRGAQLELDHAEGRLAEAEQMNDVLRQTRMPKAEELVEEDRKWEHELDLAMAKKAREDAERAEVEAAERGKKADADQHAGPNEPTGGIAGKSAEATPAEPGDGAGVAGKAEPASTRMSMAEIEKHGNWLTRRRGRPGRPNGSYTPEMMRRPPKPGSYGFIGPLPASFPPRLSGGLAPLYHGPPGPFVPEEPVDPLDDQFTDVWREDR